MSHFLTFVLVERGEADVAGKVRELMRPYFATDDGHSSGDRLAKCDGYVIGGRFDGQLFGAAAEYNLTPAEFQRRYGFDVLKDEQNIRAAPEVPAELIPYAFVTPEGAWLDRVKKGPAAWAAEVRELLRRYANCLVVAVDCHC
jgi:hypothetical protein